MGIFDFFRSKKSVLPEVKVATDLMPTVKADPELFKCYDEVFWEMIPGVSGISKKEAGEIHQVVTRCDGGFLNQGGYYSKVWDKYFKGKDWRWTEYEEWLAIFSKLGRYPLQFPARKGSLTPTVAQALEKFKVDELKALCAEHQLVVVPKAKKADLIDTLSNCPSVQASSLVTEKLDEMKARFEYTLYSSLMWTISSRAKSLWELKRAQRIGVKKFEILHAFDEDKEFISIALKKKPGALHPLYPGDASIKQAVIDF